MVFRLLCGRVQQNSECCDPMILLSHGKILFFVWSIVETDEVPDDIVRPYNVLFWLYVTKRH
jgi:hypothetical protein